MHHIVTMLRLMTHINISATIALVAWLGATVHASRIPNVPEHTDAWPAVTSSAGAVR